MLAAIAYHTKVRLTDFTAFADVTFEFCPGVNVVIGENGTGKTHLLKAMYAFQRAGTREAKDLPDTLTQLFQCQDTTRLRRVGTSRGSDNTTLVNGQFGGLEWLYLIEPHSVGITKQPGFGKPVFLPAIDMMGHSNGFQQRKYYLARSSLQNLR